MKLLLIYILVVLSSCSSAKYQEKAFNKRIYSPCKPAYTKGNFTIENYKMKVCRHYCIKWKFLRENTTLNCKKWAIEELNFTDNHDRFSTARFILININSIEN